MAVKITQPARNLREELNELRTPTGIAGEAMLRADTPQEQFNLIGAGRKNLIINGAMQVWQRGTSFSGFNGYTADHIQMQSQFADITVERVQDAVGLYHLKATKTGSSLFNNIVFPVENGRNLLAGKKLTFSCWVRCNIDSTIEFNFRRSSAGVGGGDLVTDGIASAQVTKPVSTEWAYYTHTTEVPSNYEATDVNLIAQIGFYGIGSGNYIEIKEVQLELGKVATPFEHRSYGEELALCQRYYEVIDQWWASGYGDGTSAQNNTVHMAVAKRATPTLTYAVGGASTNAGTPIVFAVSGNSIYQAQNASSAAGYSRFHFDDITIDAEL